MPNINDVFPSTYLKASDIRGKEPVVTIDRVEFEPVGRKREMKAVIYFNRCNYDRSAEAISEFNAVYPDLRKEVEAILSKFPDNAQFYDYILKIKSGEAGLSERARTSLSCSIQKPCG